MNHSKTQPGRRAVTKTLLTALCSSILAMVAADTWAQTATYPDKPIKWVVPVPAGGGMDAVTRIVSAGMATALNQPIVVDNRSGAVGTIGTGYVAQSAPDGYTVLTIDNSLFATAHLVFSKLAIRTQRPETRRHARAHSARTGGAWRQPKQELPGFHPVREGEPRKDQLRFPWRRIAPARGNGTAADADGHEDAARALSRNEQHPDGPVDWNNRGRVGRPRLREILRRVRTDQDPRSRHGEAAVPLPAVPTLDELEVKNVPISLWFALAVPAATPEAAVTRLAHAAQLSLESPEAKSKFETIGAQVFLKTGSEVTAFGREQAAFWESVVKPMAIKLD